MTQIATVETRVRPGVVRLAVRRDTACGHDCANCGGCAAAGGQVLRVLARDPLGTAPGDKVVVESGTGQVLAAAALVYLLPLLTLILGWAVGESLGGGALTLTCTTAAGFCLGLVPAVLLDRRGRARREITFTVLEKL